jgi:hypothetical protein
MSMLKVGFFILKPDKDPDFHSWMEELQRRIEEVLETFRAKGTRHELVVVLEQTYPPIVVYAVEAEDFSRVQEVFEKSKLTIDIEHKAVLGIALQIARHIGCYLTCLYREREQRSRRTAPLISRGPKRRGAAAHTPATAVTAHGIAICLRGSRKRPGTTWK